MLDVLDEIAVALGAIVMMLLMLALPVTLALIWLGVL